ncbi:MAG: DUF1697 domain-containing protein [Flavobacteriaceae bacterium]|nr:DUF1697 domain-containing protein [Flavobacteriaceae bacterium]
MANKKYIAFLRGINVGGHHKVPMAELRNEMVKMNFDNVITILNSGNIVFTAKASEIEHMQRTISDNLSKAFGFNIPTIIRKSEMIQELIDNNPFKGIILAKDIRLSVSFLSKNIKTDLHMPWTSDDNSYSIIGKIDNNIFSVLDLSINHTPKAMEVLEKYFGKNITTRNWNTIKRIAKKL